MIKDNKIADTELEIMKIVWKNKTPTISSEIVKKLKALKGWKETTIYTLISRLVEKGFLTQEKQKQASYYTPTIAERDYTLEQTQDFIDKMFGFGTLSSMLSKQFTSKMMRVSGILVMGSGILMIVMALRVILR